MQDNAAISSLVLRLFGPLEIQLNGAPLPRLRTRKGLWLLALLTLRHDRPVDRDWLAGTLWPESPPEQALYNLRRCLSDLRQALGTEAERLTTPTARTLCLMLTDAWVDVNGFDAALAAARPGALEKAVALYRGPLLEGCDEEWVLAEREGRAQSYLAALESLAAQAMSRQDPAAAARYLRRAVATDPLRETAQRALLEALGAEGDMAAATLAYREYCLHLQRTLRAEPAAETRALFQRLLHRAQAAPKPATSSISCPAAPSVPARLPLPLTGFVGREPEVAEITRLLQAARLLTLLGPGGVGKTRLAVQVARQVAGEYPDGAWFVELAGLSEAAQIPQAIAATLGIREVAQQSLLEKLEAHLSDKKLLLVLDNCEHLVEEGAGIVGQLLQRAPHLTFLLTSRQRLNVEGEQEVDVLPLLTPRLPGTPERLLEFASVELFVQRAQAVRSEFELTEANAQAVAAMCHRLEGIPLAIELAAARIGVLTPSQMLVQLERRLDFLQSRRRDISERHRSVRAAIDSSYRLLSAELQRFFARLSVFRGGWSLEAAEVVCGAEEGVRGWGSGVGKQPEPTAANEAQPKVQKGRGQLEPPTPNPLDLLEQLREASLVVAEVEAESSEIRFRMLETLREYAEEQLKPEWAAELRERHTDYFLTLAAGTEKAFFSTEQTRWLQRLEQEHDNLRAALEWSLEGRGGEGERGRGGEEERTEQSTLDNRQSEIALRLIAGLGQFWHHRGYFSEGRAYCERALSQAGAQERTQWRMRALSAAAYLASEQGDFAAAQARFEESLAIGREVGDRRGIAVSVNHLGVMAYKRGDWQTAQALLTESLQTWRELGVKGGMAASLTNLGVLLVNHGDWEQAQNLLEEALAINREVGNRVWEAQCLNFLGNLAMDQSRFQEARSFYEQSLAINRSLEDKRGIAVSLNNMGLVASELQDVDTARAYYEECLALNRELGVLQGVAIVLNNLGQFVCDQGDYTAARDYMAESLKLCREMNVLSIIAYPLEEMAALAWAQGQTERAVRLFAAAKALRESISSPLPPREQAKQDGKLADLRAALGEEAFTAAWAEGFAMTLDEAIAVALTDSTPSTVLSDH